MTVVVQPAATGSICHLTRTSAHHALRDLEDTEVRRTVAPVAAALIDSEPIAVATVAAAAAMQTLRQR